MHESLDTGLKLNKRTVVGNTRYLPVDSRAHRKSFLDAGPWIRKQLLVTERNAFALTIELQDFDLNIVADPEQLVWILKPSPRHISNVKQPVDAAKIDKRTVVSQVL